MELKVVKRYEHTSRITRPYSQVFPGTRCNKQEAAGLRVCEPAVENINLLPSPLKVTSKLRADEQFPAECRVDNLFLKNNSNLVVKITSDTQ